MFSVKEKQWLAYRIEDLIKELNHPEMNNENVRFNIHIDGAAIWSYADITDNKTAVENGYEVNPWNEISRAVMGGKDAVSR